MRRDVRNADGYVVDLLQATRFKEQMQDFPLMLAPSPAPVYHRVNQGPVHGRVDTPPVVEIEGRFPDAGPLCVWRANNL